MAIIIIKVQTISANIRKFAKNRPKAPKKQGVQKLELCVPKIGTVFFVFHFYVFQFCVSNTELENAKLISQLNEVFVDLRKITESLPVGGASESQRLSKTDDFLLAILIELKQLHHLLIPAKPVLSPELLERLIDGKEAAKILNTCTKTVSRAREDGTFKAYWISGKAYYDPDQIMAFRRFYMK